jgi:hypothetical protein
LQLRYSQGLLRIPNIYEWRTGCWKKFPRILEHKVADKKRQNDEGYYSGEKLDLPNAEGRKSNSHNQGTHHMRFIT